MIAKTCKRCHNEYYSVNKFYCSNFCLRFKEVTGKCKECDKDLFRINQIYCGAICRNINNIKKAICKNDSCDKLVSRAKAVYCSKKCMLDFIKAEEKFCIYCDKKLKHTTIRVFCYSCYEKQFNKLVDSEVYTLDDIRNHIKVEHNYCSFHKSFYVVFCKECRLINRSSGLHCCNGKECSRQIRKGKTTCMDCLKKKFENKI